MLIIFLSNENKKRLLTGLEQVCGCGLFILETKVNEQLSVSCEHSCYFGWWDGLEDLRRKGVVNERGVILN